MGLSRSFEISYTLESKTNHGRHHVAQIVLELQFVGMLQMP